MREIKYRHAERDYVASGRGNDIDIKAFVDAVCLRQNATPKKTLKKL